MKLAVGLPYHYYWEPQTVASLMELFAGAYEHKLDLTVIPFLSSVVTFSRNHIAQSFLESPCSHLLWIDSDAQFSMDDVLSLIRREVDIVSCVAVKKREPYQPALGCVRIVEGKVEGHQMDLDYTSSDCVRLTGRYPGYYGFVGHHLCLVKKEVYQKIEKPFYETPSTSSFKELIGEDVYFCIKAQEAGFKVYVDLNCKVDHIGPYPYNIWTYLDNKEREKNV